MPRKHYSFLGDKTEVDRKHRIIMAVSKHGRFYGFVKDRTLAGIKDKIRVLGCKQYGKPFAEKVYQPQEQEGDEL